jgi:autotransporter-associated beta strand protein
VIADGDFDISATTAGASVRALNGTGAVALGDQTLTVTASDGAIFAGVTSGNCGLTAAGGAQGLSGQNAYAGATRIAAGAVLGLVAQSEVIADGVLTIAPSDAGAAIRTLSGSGVVDLGDRPLALTNADTNFAGQITGAGGVTVAGGRQGLSGINLYADATQVQPGATLALTGAGSIEASAGVKADGTLDIAATTAGARIRTLAGKGSVELGAQDLTLTAASTHFEGSIRDTGGLTVEAGRQDLAGANAFTGITRIDGGAVLGLETGASLATSPSCGWMARSICPPGGGRSRSAVQGAGNTFTAGGTIRPVLRGITGDATNSFVPAMGRSFRIVEAEGGVLGSADGLVQPAEGLPAGTRLEALDGAQDITLHVTPERYQDLSVPGVRLRGNQAAVGGALDALRPAAGVRTGTETTHVLRVLFSQAPSGLPQVMDRLGGTIYGDALVTAVGNNRMFGDTVVDQAGGRAGARGASIAMPGGRYVVWGSGFGGNARTGAEGNTGYRSSLGGFAGGVGMRLGAGLQAGLAIGYGGASCTSRDTSASAGQHHPPCGLWRLGGRALHPGRTARPELRRDPRQAEPRRLRDRGAGRWHRPGLQRRDRGRHALAGVPHPPPAGRRTAARHGGARWPDGDGRRRLVTAGRGRRRYQPARHGWPARRQHLRAGHGLQPDPGAAGALVA